MRPTKLVTIACLLVMVGMLIYPPWVHQEENGEIKPMGYGFIWQPPQRELSAEFLGLRFSASEEANSIDFARLAAQELAALALLASAAGLSRLMNGGYSKRREVASERTRETVLR